MCIIANEPHETSLLSDTNRPSKVRISTVNHANSSSNYQGLAGPACPCIPSCKAGTLKPWGQTSNSLHSAWRKLGRSTNDSQELNSIHDLARYQNQPTVNSMECWPMCLFATPSVTEAARSPAVRSLTCIFSPQSPPYDKLQGTFLSVARTGDTTALESQDGSEHEK